MPHSPKPEKENPTGKTLFKARKRDFVGQERKKTLDSERNERTLKCLSDLIGQGIIWDKSCLSASPQISVNRHCGKW